MNFSQKYNQKLEAILAKPNVTDKELKITHDYFKGLEIGQKINENENTLAQFFIDAWKTNISSAYHNLKYKHGLTDEREGSTLWKYKTTLEFINNAPFAIIKKRLIPNNLNQ